MQQRSSEYTNVLRQMVDLQAETRKRRFDEKGEANSKRERMKDKTACVASDF